MFNLPDGNNNFLDNQDMVCEKCDCKDDVDNGEYVNHQWYCKSCYKELFKKCPKCEVIISVEEELCEDCLEEKKWEESAEGLFDKLGYRKRLRPNEIVYAETFETNMCNQVRFNLDPSVKTYDAYLNYSSSIEITIELHKAITQQMKELGWL
jgi:hypothetical protein